MADVHTFIRHWGLDEAAGAALLQLSPLARSRVLADFAPKTGTRDVTRLFYGFLRSVQNAGTTPGLVDDAGFGSFTQDDGLSGSLAEDVPPSAWQAGTSVADVEAFISHWGLDSASCEQLVAQPFDVQARVMTEFAPKPDTRDVNRLFQGFINSVSTTSLPHVTNQGFQSGRREIGCSATPSRAMPAQSSLTSDENLTNGGWGWTRQPPRSLPSHRKNNERSDVHAFIKQWELDVCSQMALLQLDPEVQARVLVEFAPKSDTRDVNRLLQGFIKSVQSAPANVSTLHEATARVVAGASQPGPSQRRLSVLINSERTNACRWSTRSPSAASSATATDSSKIQEFVDKWGLDADSVAALVQLDSASQLRVAGEFAPKANTQDVNRLFRGFIRSVVNSGSSFLQRSMPTSINQLNSESGSEVGEGVTADIKPWARARAPATHSSTEDIPAAFDARRRRAPTEAPTMPKMGGGTTRRSWLPRKETTDQAVSKDAKMAEPVDPLEEEEWDSGVKGNAYGIPAILPDSTFEADFGAPLREDLSNFVKIWGLGDEDLVTLEGQAPDVQQRVLEQFSPKPGTRDVRSLFHGFMRSVAQGRGVKRPRTD